MLEVEEITCFPFNLEAPLEQLTPEEPSSASGQELPASTASRPASLLTASTAAVQPRSTEQVHGPGPLLFR